MKNIILICICFIFIFSCKKETSLQKEAISDFKSSFAINGTIKNFYPQKVYLNKIIENSNYIIDSCKIVDNNFNFKGYVEYPERFSLSFEEYSYTTILIIENTTIEVKIDGYALNSPSIKGSPLNDLWFSYKLNSKKIFKQIEYLFPHFQKYRLENNAEKLSELNNSMKTIEQEFLDFSYNFIKKNNNSYISPIILRDQLKTHPIDTLKIMDAFNQLSDNVKLSPDSQIIIHQLGFH